jgi:hypothetical protein
VKLQAKSLDLRAVEFGAGNDRLMAAIAQAEGKRQAWVQVAKRADGREQNALGSAWHLLPVCVIATLDSRKSKSE